MHICGGRILIIKILHKQKSPKPKASVGHDTHTPASAYLFYIFITHIHTLKNLIHKFVGKSLVYGPRFT
jgi:hypothetical protein